MAQTKPLHLGNTIDDLEIFCTIPDVSHRNFKILLTTAKKLYTTAEEQRLDGDEELAYISYMKYFNLLSCIHQKPEYKQNKLTVRQMLGDKETNHRIMDKLEKISDSLLQRYSQKRSADAAVALNASPPSERAKSPATKIAKSDFNKMRLISCEQLFERMKQKNVLVMDCRASVDYENSHLTYAWAFNVPEEIISAGMSAGKLQDKLDSSAKAKWSARSVKDNVVLLDWNNRDVQPASNSAIAILLDILQNWDPDVYYREPIQILDGGYEYFIMMYPTVCTNPSVQAPQQNNNDMETIDDIEYPSIHDITMKDEVRERDFSLAPEKSALKTINTVNHCNQRPNIDRSSKLIAMRTYEQKRKPIYELEQEHEKLLKKAQANDVLLEKAAKKWETIIDLKRLSADGATLTNSEQELIYNIMQLESIAEDFKVENNRLRDELNAYKQLESTEKQLLTPKEVEVTKQIESKIHERQLLDEQHDREREKRERLLAIAREAKRNINNSITAASSTATLATTSTEPATPTPSTTPTRPTTPTHPTTLTRPRTPTKPPLSVTNSPPPPTRPTTPTKAPLSVTHSPPPLMQAKQPTLQSLSEKTLAYDSAMNGNMNGVEHVQDVDHYENKENAIFTKPFDKQQPQFDRSMKPQSLRTKNYYNDNLNTAHRQRDFSPVSGGNMSYGLTGLKNLGNTCYMNSILQCLSNTPQLTEYCITDKYKNYISRDNKTKGHIVEEVAALIKVLWNNNYKCVSSKNLCHVVGEYQQIFRGYEQQDSHEFLTILMDWLHSDLQTLQVTPRVREIMSASEKAWFEFTKSKESLILHLFYGQIKSTVKCATCNKESATYECFSNLSLELPCNTNVCYLSQCMDMYFSGESIHGWNCPSCKQKRDAIKKLDISKLPPVLVVHLKRFYADPAGAELSYKKKQNYVRFPLEDLDMTPYIAKAESRTFTPKTYQLYGVSNHYGSMESGHYTAFCKSANYGRWFKFDDQIVNSLDTSNVVSSAAYILFYTWLPPIPISDCN